MKHAVLALILVLAACSSDQTGETAGTIPPGEGGESAAGAVESLVSAINAPDFGEASRFAMPGQAALASLAEGAAFVDVADALRSGDQEVAANFWAGFAQGSGRFLVGSVEAANAGTHSEDEIEFTIVEVTPPDGDSRQVLMREENGWRIDLFASFGSGLADKMIAPVERLLGTQTDDARLILTELKTIVPSLLAAAHQPGTPTDVAQQLLALVEVITRVS
ncbi:MAG: hypothetical protein PVG83_09310 [Acidimicrobiia bacterium]|jgi:hypothetical protein